jgi:hypothetical protein
MHWGNTRSPPASPRKRPGLGRLSPGTVYSFRICAANKTYVTIGAAKTLSTAP